ncbi:MAG: phosphate ABC transporter permease subunit PstC, partial [Terriglobus roseus]|nr:phosphate ABC transporter permease subunit PstC [Terriglobus roseus]
MAENETSHHKPIPLPALKRAAASTSAAAAAAGTAVRQETGIRSFLASRGSGRVVDRSFAVLMLLGALSLFVIMVLIVWILVQDSNLSIHAFGMHFFANRNWDPVNGDFGALPFIFGTLVSSLLALIIAVPLSLAVAIFVLEICPVPLRSSISFLTELLAAIPSVVYGLWAVFVLVPLVRDKFGPLLEKLFGWTGLFA